MEKTGPVQAPRDTQDSPVTLNATQIGLAVGVVSVCCLMAFGGGVIAGMWYKASEQTTPYSTTLAALTPDPKAPAPRTTEEPAVDPRVTFYDALKAKTPYAQIKPQGGQGSTGKTPPAAVIPPPLAGKTTVANSTLEPLLEPPKAPVPTAPGSPANSPQSAPTAPQNFGNLAASKTSSAPLTPAALPGKTTVASSAREAPPEAPKVSAPTASASSSSSAKSSSTAQQQVAGSNEPSKNAVATLKSSSTAQQQVAGSSEPSKNAVAAPQAKTVAMSASPGLKPAVAPAAPKVAVANIKPAVAPAPTPNTPAAVKPVVASPSPTVATAAAKESPKDTAKEPSTASRVAAIAAAAKSSSNDTDSPGRRQADAPPAAAPRTSEGQYSVQAGSFRSPEQAEKLRSQLAQKGYQARVQLFTSPNNESWYRVRVGNFSDRTVAGQTAQTLSSREQVQTVVANDQR